MSGYSASPCSSLLPLSAPSAGPRVTVSGSLAGHPGLDSKPINTSLGSPRPPADYPCQVKPGQSWGRMEVDYVLRKSRRRSRSSALLRAYGLPSYPGACWSPLNGTPHKSRLCQCVRRSEAVPVLLFGRDLLLGGHWDTRMSKEQLAHSEQTAAPQETLSISSLPSSSAPTNTQRRLGSISFPSHSILFAAFVSPGCLLSLDLANRINRTDKAD